MRTTTTKRILSAILAICLVFGSAAALPKSAFNNTTTVVASAESEPQQGGQQDESEKIEAGFVYREEDDKAIIEKYIGTDNIVTVPSTLGGKTVFAINNNAFSNNDTITEVTILEGTVEIRNAAFENCRNLTAVKFADTVKVISPHAFDSCEKLAKADLAKVEYIGNGAFARTALASVVLPDSVTEVEAFAFAECENLASITFGSGMDTVPELAFESCPSLKSVTIPSGYKAIGSGAFSNCLYLESVTLPEGLKIIDGNAFAYTSIKSINLPASVDTLGSWAFMNTQITVDGINLDNIKHIGRETFLITPWLREMRNKNQLVIVNDILVDSVSFTGKTLTVPNTIREIAGQGISHVENLEKVVIPDSVKIIGDNAFDSCPNLKEFNISANVESIGANIIYGCPKFAGYTVDKNNKTYTAVDGILYKKDMKTLLSCPATKTTFTNKGEFTVPDSVEVIADGAFTGCKGLTKINMPKGLKTLGNGAFSGSGLTTVELPESIDAIGSNTFSDLSNLTSVEIPSTVKIIGDHAFANNEKLAEVILNEGLTAVEDDAFANCPSLKSVIVPESLEHIGWSAFGTTYEQLAGGAIERYDKDFTFYAYSYGTPAKPYAEEREMKFVRIATKVRMAGNNRYGTAIAISQASFKKAETVIIASGTGYADALAGVSLATMSEAPILLTAPTSISKETLEEIKRLGAKNAIILGGTGAVSEKVEKALKDNGVTKVERLGGKTRFETATLIADKMVELSGKKSPENLFFVYYNNFADAVSISSAAGATNSPVLFAATNGDLDASTKAYIEKVKKDVKNVYVIGGEGVISDDMMKTINKYTGKTATRLGGKTRFDTNLAVIKEFANGPKALSNSIVGLATGMDYPDALTGGVVAAMVKAPMLLVNPKAGLSKDQIIAIKEQKEPEAEDFIVTAFGGTGVISDQMLREACMAIQFKDNHQGGGIPFEDSELYKFLQRLDSEPIEAEMSFTVAGVPFSTTVLKKSGNNAYTYSTSMMGVEECYTIDGKTYTLDAEEKTYTVEDAGESDSSVISMVLIQNAKFEVLSSRLDNDNIVEEVRQTIKNGDEETVSEIVCTFDKETGDLKKIESVGGEVPMTLEVKGIKPGPAEITLPDLSDWTEVKENESFEDSHTFAFLQKVKTEQFEAEMVLTMPDIDGSPVAMDVKYKKGDNAVYQWQDTPMGVIEQYKVGDKQYFLLTQGDIKTYNVKDNDGTAAKSIVETFFTENETYELASCNEDGDNIVEEIEATSGEDKYKLVCTFNKETGLLTRIETVGAGVDTSLDIKSYKTGPLEINLPDLTDWRKDDTIVF